MHTSIAERLAFGTPLDPVADDTPIHLVPRAGTALIARILMSAIFLTSGIAKLVDPAGAQGYMNMAGIPHADILVYVAGFAELLGGLALLLGFLTRIGALGLFIFLIPTTLAFHGFWNMEGAEAKTQMVNFMKNLAIMGGLLAIYAWGPGRYSVDARIRRPIQP
ncbi:MAG TPA: DoxX family protein [Kofleriaceae bacterium]|nr:DoxX family protein [Kofleriaceae bacterium]